MARLIAVSIDCRNEAARQTFEEILSRRRDYLVTKGQGTGSVDMLLLEVDEYRPQETFGQIRRLLSEYPDLEVFLTASRTDPQVLLEAFRLGVREFLPQPLTRQEVEPALIRFEERFGSRMSGAEVQAGRVISVIGARGGVGTSTVATNLAVSVQLARPRESVALVDLDIHGGDLGLFLDLHSSQGLKQLAKDVSRLDATIVGSSLARHSCGVQLLASGFEGWDDVASATGSTMRVLGLLRSMHRRVFVDCGHVLEPAVKESLDCSDQIIVVTTLSLPAIRRTKRVLEALGAGQRAAAKVTVLVNRYMSDQKELLSETESVLGLRVGGVIPNDYRTAREAIDQGKPMALLATRTAIGQWYLRGADSLTGEKPVGNDAGSGQEHGRKGSFFSRYLSGLGLETREKTSPV